MFFAALLYNLLQLWVENRQGRSTWCQHSATFVALCFSNSHRNLTCKPPLLIIKNITLLSDSSHCKHAEFSTVPLTLTVSICPFTDSVLGGVLLEAETLTVEREMWICNNITGNKKRHYEHAITGWRIEQFSFKTLIQSVGGIYGKYLFSFSFTIFRWCSTFLSSFLLFLLLSFSTSANLCSRFFLTEDQSTRKQRMLDTVWLAKIN